MPTERPRMTIDAPCLARRLSKGLGAAPEAGRVGTRRGWYARKKGGDSVEDSNRGYAEVAFS